MVPLSIEGLAIYMLLRVMRWLCDLAIDNMLCGIELGPLFFFFLFFFLGTSHGENFGRKKRVRNTQYAKEKNEKNHDEPLYELGTVCKTRAHHVKCESRYVLLLVIWNSLYGIAYCKFDMLWDQANEGEPARMTFAFATTTGRFIFICRTFRRNE